MQPFSRRTLSRDLAAGMVVFLVALPLCLGIAHTSQAVPPIAGIVAGVIGGIVVGWLSGSHTSVSGPTAAMTAIVASQIAGLGSFEMFLLALVYAGIIQIVMGLARLGTLATLIPTAVIQGLLSAIGLILILKQIPHLLGQDADPDGDMSFFQVDQQNTFSELFKLGQGFHLGAATVGLISLGLMIFWSRSKALKDRVIPGSLVVVILGVILHEIFEMLGSSWAIQGIHHVNVPVTTSILDLNNLLLHPDFAQWANPRVLLSGFIIALACSLETLLNLEAIDKLDTKHRESPPMRELLAQGVGNILSGLIGGIPLSSSIIPSSVNLNAGGRSKQAAIIHGGLMLACVVLMPTWLNRIPLSCLAAILIVTGAKLVAPVLKQEFWRGRQRLLLFVWTVLAILFTDLLIGGVLGLGAGLLFIVLGTMRQPLKTYRETHVGGPVTHIELPGHASFLNRHRLTTALRGLQRGEHVLIDGSRTDIIDPDVLELIQNDLQFDAQRRGLYCSLRGLQRFGIEDQTLFVDHLSRELQDRLTPLQVLDLLKEGHARFRSGRRLFRDTSLLVTNTADGQFPLAVVLGCIDSRTPAEIIFDLGVGDIFSARVAGNTTSPKILGSIEYACAVAGAKLVLVLGHTRCGAVTAAVKFAISGADVSEATGCEHLEEVVRDIQLSIRPEELTAHKRSADLSTDFVEAIARRNVSQSVSALLERSSALRKLVAEGRLAIVGAMYDVTRGEIEFMDEIGPG